MAKISLDVFTHKGKTFTQFIDTDDDSVTIEMMAGKTRQPMIHFDSSCNVRSTDGKNIGNIGGGVRMRLPLHLLEKMRLRSPR